jgi:hypothetical protein
MATHSAEAAESRLFITQSQSNFWDKGRKNGVKEENGSSKKPRLHPSPPRKQGNAGCRPGNATRIPLACASGLHGKKPTAF